MSATLVEGVRGFIAVGSVTAQVGPVFKFNRGFTGVVRNGAGDYTLTLQDGITLAEAQPQVTCLSATLAAASVELATATTLRVRTFVNNAAAEADFGIQILNVGPS